MGGVTATAVDSDHASVHDRNLIIPLVLVVILVILVLLLRALVAPLVLVGTVVLSFGATLGVSALVFDHVLTSYGDNGESVYDPPRVEIGFHQGVAVDIGSPLDVDKVADDVVARIHADQGFAAYVAQQLVGRPEATLTERGE